MTKTEELDSKAALKTFLKQNEENHYNFEDEVDYKVSCGSLKVDFELNGGLGPGLHRFTGINEGGKSSEALEVMKNFLKMPNSKGVYIKAEGRLSKEMKKRCGINFTDKDEEWTEGKCFIFDCNIYETVLDLMRVLVAINPEETKPIPTNLLTNHSNFVEYKKGIKLERRGLFKRGGYKWACKDSLDYKLSLTTENKLALEFDTKNKSEESKPSLNYKY